MARQRAISVRRRSPPDNWLPLFFLTFCKRNSAIRLSSFLSDTPKACRSFPVQMQYCLPHSFDGRRKPPAPNNRYPSAHACIPDISLYPDHSRRYVLIGSNQPYGHIKRSCLTGAIRPQQTDNLPLLHINGHMAHYRTLSVLFHQILRTQHHATFLPWLCPGSQA